MRKELWLRVRREVVLEHPPHVVWSALTASDRVSEWFGAEAKLELRPGGAATFTWPDGSTRRATVEAVEEQRLLLLRWLPFVTLPGGRTAARRSSIVEFVLTAVEGGTRLAVVESDLPSGAVPSGPGSHAHAVAIGGPS